MAEAAWRPCVLQVTTGADDGEAGDDTVEVAAALQAAGWTATVAGATPGIERELARLRVPHLALPAVAGGRLARWRTAHALARFARRHRAVVIHARSAAAAALAGPAAQAVDASFLTTVYAIDDALTEPAAIGGDRVIAVSQAAADELGQRLGVEAARVRVVRRWVALDRFDPAAVRGHQVVAVAERSGVPAGPRVIALPATTARHDDHGLLAALLPLVRTADLLLLVVGDLDREGAQVRRLRGMLDGIGWSDRLRFCAGDDLPAALALSDVLLVPATQSGTPLRLVVAAQAMGRPVVVTDVGALSEAVMPAVTGWLVGADGPAEAARAVDLALQMPDDARDRLAGRARAFAIERFDAGTQIRREIAVYGELCRRAPADA